MSDQKIDCYIIPSMPLPMILPVECVAEIASSPEVEALKNAPAKWMEGHANWRNQRIPVLSYTLLQNVSAKERSKDNPHLVILNPIPHAARKAYSALLCYGDIQKITVEPNMEFTDAEGKIDRRYVDGVIKVGSKDHVVPKLAALGVAFSYF